MLSFSINFVIFFTITFKYKILFNPDLELFRYKIAILFTNIALIKLLLLYFFIFKIFLVINLRFL